MATISVVIPTWNGLELLQRTVASLRSQSRRPDEVVVVDNGSTDGTVQWARGCGLRVVAFAENTGFAAAVNAGLRAAGGELVLVVNNDVECAPDCLERLEQAAAGASWAAWLAPKIVAWDGQRIECAGVGLRPDFFALPIGSGDPAEQWDRPLEVFGASFGACLLRRSLVASVGPLAEEYFAYYEDVDFAARCRLMGFRCLYVPAAVVRHLGGATARRLGPRVRYLSARNQLWTVFRCCPGRLAVALGPRLVRGQIANLAAAAREGHLCATAAGKVAAVVGLWRQVRARGRIMAAAKATDDFRRWLERPWREI